MRLQPRAGTFGEPRAAGGPGAAVLREARQLRPEGPAAGSPAPSADKRKPAVVSLRREAAA